MVHRAHISSTSLSTLTICWFFVSSHPDRCEVKIWVFKPRPLPPSPVELQGSYLVTSGQQFPFTYQSQLTVDSRKKGGKERNDLKWTILIIFSVFCWKWCSRDQSVFIDTRTRALPASWRLTRFTPDVFLFYGPYSNQPLESLSEIDNLRSQSYFVPGRRDIKEQSSFLILNLQVVSFIPKFFSFWVYS